MLRTGTRRDPYFHRLIGLSIFLLVVVAGLVYRTSTLMLGEENREKVNLVLMNRAPLSLQKLNEHAKKLESMTADIEQYSFAGIRGAIEETTHLVTLTNRELKAQYDAWLEIQTRIKSDAGSFYRLRDQLDEIQNLQDQQILDLKRMLEAAEKPSVVDDFINLSLTFLLGVFSSLLASAAWAEWKNRR